MLRKLGSRVIHGCRFRWCSQISHKKTIDLLITGFQCEIPHYIINILTTHGMLVIQKNSTNVYANTLNS